MLFQRERESTSLLPNPPIARGPENTATLVRENPTISCRTELRYVSAEHLNKEWRDRDRVIHLGGERLEATLVVALPRVRSPFPDTGRVSLSARVPHLVSERWQALSLRPTASAGRIAA